MKLINSKFLFDLPNYSLSEVENLISLFSSSNLKNQNIQISHSLLEAVLQLLEEIAKEKKDEFSSNLFLEKEEFTSQEAADYINVSHSYLIELLENGEIPFHKTGTDYRIEAKDIFEYDELLRQYQNKNLEELAKQAQELNLGYNE
jgi:excisionase family DNA binding protein